jgi:hypothetical protein
MDFNYLIELPYDCKINGLYFRVAEKLIRREFALLIRSLSPGIEFKIFGSFVLTIF